LVLATPVTSSNLRNQAPLFAELRLLQGTQNIYYKNKIYQICLFWYIKICYIHIDFTVFNRGNLLNWLYHGLNLYENLRNLAAMLCAYIKILLMAALIYLHTSMKNTNNLQITTHTTIYTVDPFLKEP